MRVFKLLVGMVVVVGFVGCASAEQDEAALTVAKICCGSGCCLIDSECYTNGEDNPTNSEQECDPSESQTQWTDKGSGDGGTDGGSSDAGTDGGSTDGGGTDAGTDAGSGSDAGTGSGGGSGCAVHGNNSNRAGWLFAIVSGLAFMRRRSHRSHH